MTDKTRYPLTWPEGWPRTPQYRRQRAKFGTQGAETRRSLSISEAVDRVGYELDRLHARASQTIISTNLALRQDGLPKSGQSNPIDPGVAVYWMRQDDKIHKVMAIDHYDRVQDNLAAVAATLQAMRAIERHGGAKILERAFTGFTALPAPGQTTKPWRQVLGVADSTLDFAVVERAYRTMRSFHHPDRPGGNADEFHLVEQAWAQAKKEFDR